MDTLVELKNVSVFQQKIMILKDVNLEINKGEFVYLVGRTGSGKSSLMKLLYADLPLVEGVVLQVLLVIIWQNLKIKKFLICVVNWGLFFRIFSY